MRRAFHMILLMAGVSLLLATHPTPAAAKANPKPDLTFIGAESVATQLPCTAAYTDKSLGNTVCSVYSGTISGAELGKGWQSGMVDITITRAAAGDTSPVGCHGMYLNIQFANGSESGMQTMYGFGSVCGPDNQVSNYQSGANLTGNGGWALIDPNGNGTAVGTFAATFTPEKGVAGDNLILTFQKAAQGGK